MSDSLESLESLLFQVDPGGEEEKKHPVSVFVLRVWHKTGLRAGQRKKKRTVLAPRDVQPDTVSLFFLLKIFYFEGLCTPLFHLTSN